MTDHKKKPPPVTLLPDGGAPAEKGNLMKKFILASVLIASVAALAGCGAVDRMVAHFTGYSKICVDGVSYLQFTSGASVQFDKAGKPVPCTD